MVERSTWRQILASFPVYVLNILNGMSYAWAASNMNYLKSDEGHRLTHEQCTLIASLLHFGRLCAPMTSVTVTGMFGRKPALILSGTLMWIAYTLIFTSKSASTIYLARFILGFGIGTSDCFGIIYMGEISKKSVRGIFLTFCIAFYYVGTVIQYAIAFYFPFGISSTVPVIMTSIAVSASYFLQESPYWLCITKQEEKAKKVLMWLRACDEKKIEGDLRDISNMETVAGLSEFFRNFKKPEVYRSYCIVFTLGIISSTLMTTLISFANFVVPDSKLVSSSHFGILFCCIPLCTTFTSTFIIDKFERRSLLFRSFLAETFFNATFAVMFFTREKNIVQLPNFSWIVFSIIIVYLTIYSLATYPPSVALRTELFPPSYKVLGMNLCILLNSATNVCCTFFFMKIIQVSGMYLNYVIFTGCCIVGSCIAFFLIPETKGKTLAEIQIIMRGRR